jgi:hypothetical protein
MPPALPTRPRFAGPHSAPKSAVFPPQQSQPVIETPLVPSHTPAVERRSLSTATTVPSHSQLPLYPVRPDSRPLTHEASIHTLSSPPIPTARRHQAGYYQFSMTQVTQALRCRLFSVTLHVAPCATTATLAAPCAGRQRSKSYNVLNLVCFTKRSVHTGGPVAAGVVALSHCGSQKKLLINAVPKFVARRPRRAVLNLEHVPAGDTYRGTGRITAWHQPGDLDG